MLALARLLVFGFLGLSVIYLAVSFYSRRVRRSKLEMEWEEDNRGEDRDTFVEAGLRDYDRSLRRKLILGVYVVPLLIILFIVYMTNFS